MHMARFLRVHPAKINTPFEPVVRPCMASGVGLWIKRDNYTVRWVNA